MFKSKKTGLLAAIVLAGGLLLGNHAAEAGLAGQTCGACHTMHNSQNGISMTTLNGAGDSARDYLLMYRGCLACHTSDQAGGKLNTDTSAPAVHHTGGDPGAGFGYNAGGSFWYPLDDETKGHNIADLNSPDTNHPGGGANTPGDSGTFDPANLTCTSCHGSGNMHHANVGGSDANAGTQVQTVWVKGTGAASYRFLTGSIWGGEKGDWEFSGAAGNIDEDEHNIYSSGGVYTSDSNGISSLCNNCHGDFHGTGTEGSGSGSSPWARHPTDIGLEDTGGEFDSYGTYWASVPIAVINDDITTTGIVVTMTDYDSMVDRFEYVVCVSCHRAHGSEYHDMLRWSYSSVVAGTSGSKVGCTKCHTSK